MSIKTEIKNLLSEAKINDKIKKRKISIAQSVSPNSITQPMPSLPEGPELLTPAYRVSPNPNPPTPPLTNTPSSITSFTNQGPVPSTNTVTTPTIPTSSLTTSPTVTSPTVTSPTVTSPTVTSPTVTSPTAIPTVASPTAIPTATNTLLTGGTSVAGTAAATGTGISAGAIAVVVLGTLIVLSPIMLQEYQAILPSPEEIKTGGESAILTKITQTIYKQIYDSCEKHGLWNIDVVNDLTSGYINYGDAGDIGALNANTKKQLINKFSSIFMINLKSKIRSGEIGHVKSTEEFFMDQICSLEDMAVFQKQLRDSEQLKSVLKLIANDIQATERVIINLFDQAKKFAQQNKAQTTTGTPQRTSSSPATSNSVSSKIAQLRQTLNGMGYQNNQSSPSWDEDLDSAFTKCFISWAQKLFPNAKDLDLAPPISWVLEAPKLGLTPNISGALDFAVAAQKAFSQIQNNPQNAPQNASQNPAQNPNSPQTLALEGLEAFFNMVNSGLVKIDKKGIDLRNDTKIWKGVIGGLGGSKSAAVHCLKNANFTDEELKTLASIKGASQAQVQGLSQSSAIQKVFTLFLNLYRKSTKAPFRARNPEKIQERVSETNPKEAILKNIELRKQAIRRKFNQ